MNFNSQSLSPGFILPYRAGARSPLSMIADGSGGDAAGDITTTHTVSVGGTVTGTISGLTDQDWYAVTLTAGQSVFISLTGSGTGFDPYLRIYGSDAFSSFGLRLEDNNSGVGNGAFTAFTAATSGTYYIAASGYRATTGSYSLSLATPPADDIGGTAATAGSLALGATASGVISSASDVDLFAVTLAANTTYVFTLNAAAAGGVPAMGSGNFGIATSDGSSLNITGYADGLSPDGTAASFVFVSTTAGTYYLHVNGQAYQAPVGGAYSVSYAQTPADVAAGAGTTTSLAVGSSLQGFIQPSGDHDWYSVSLVAGQSYVFKVADGAWSLGSHLTLRTADGSEVAAGTGQSLTYYGDFIHYTAAQSGTYYLDVGSVWTSQNGDYALSAALEAPDIVASAATTATLAPGQTFTSYLSGASDADWVAVSVTAGQTYAFCMDDTAAFINPFLSLVTASGTVLASDDNSGLTNGSQILFTATASQTLYLSASLAAGYTTGGDYILTMRTVSDAIGNTTSTSQALAVGATATTVSDYSGDHDWFAVTLQAGSTYDFALDSSATDYVWSMSNPSAWGAGGDLSIMNASGTAVATRITGNDTTILRYTAATTGTYYINAGLAQELSYPGVYSVSATLRDTVAGDRSTTGRLTVGQTLNGAIDFAATDDQPADVDWYAVTLQANQGYTFTFGDTNIPTVNMVLYNSAGASLAGGFNIANIQYYATTAGTYYVGVSDFTGSNTGNYSLSAVTNNDIFAGTNTQGQLAVGGSFSSTIEVSGDQDWYRIELVAGQSYRFEVQQSGANPLGDCYLTLYNSYGSQIAYNDDGGTWPNSLLRFTATESGTYYVGASGFYDTDTGTTATGDYTVKAAAVPPQDPRDTIDWGTQITDTTVSIYFAGSGETWLENTAERAWTADEKAAFLAACQTWSEICNVTFTETSSSTGANMVVLLDTLDDNTAAFMQVPPGTPQVGVFDPYWDTTLPAPGNIWFSTFIHEVGHFLGLAHPHDSGGGSEVMEGVNVYSDLGPYGLNQGVYTIMSYNDGFNGLVSAYYGDVATPMAIDASVVQQKYGATSRNTGNNTYTLTSETTGSYYSLIWDTGGTDTLVNSSTNGATLDLRTPTFVNGVGGGGYVSYVTGGNGGYVIADGVVIENATGNIGNDVINGNSANNILLGGGGSDIMSGGLGNDTIDGGEGTNTITFFYESSGVTVDLAITAAQNTGVGMDTILNFYEMDCSRFNDRLQGNELVNDIDGGDGNDVIDGRGSTDIINGGAGNDILYGGSGNDTLTGGQGLDTLYGGEGDDNLADNSFIDSLGTVFDGGAGADTMSGGSGNDTYYTDGLDTIIDYAGYDVVYSSANYENAFAVEEIRLTGSAISANGIWYGSVVKIYGNAENNSLTGGYTNGLIDGGLGADTMSGNSGDDTYIVDNAGDVVTENADQGTDEVRSSISYTLGANVEKLVLTGSANLTATGNALDNTLTGNAGNNVLDGGTGNDTMSGGVGNDTYYVDNAGDKVVEANGGGTDTVMSAITYSIASTYIENATLTGTADLDLTGSSAGNVLTGNSGNNILNGGAGGDKLAGGDGNDTLNGGTEADLMYGGSGNDIYYVDNAGDTVTEVNGGGNDLVWSSVSFNLGVQFIEKLTLTGTGNINATGNSLANILIGNAGNNVLNGGGGIDAMNGGAGDDTYFVDNALDTITGELSANGTDTVIASISYSVATQYIENIILSGTANIDAMGNSVANTLTGNAGNNLLNGWTGADTMSGLGGDDTYIVDNLGDVVIEGNGGGTDTVLSSVNINVASQFVEIVTLTGGGSISVTANALNNILTGNSGNNTLSAGTGNDVLDGGAGADTLIGGAGNDTYYLDNAGDVISGENSTYGTDTVYASVSYNLGGQFIETAILTGSAHLSLTGNSAANTLTGNSGNNTISAGNGIDTLDGGAGNDILTGGGHADIFLFGLNSGNDRITDFSASQGDTINVRAYNAQSTAVISQQGADALINLGNGNIITVANTNATNMDFLNSIVW